MSDLESTRYALEVLRAEGLTCRMKEPKLYVTVQLGSGVPKRTRTVKTASPIWDETLTFSTSDASMILHIWIQTDSKLPKAKRVAYASLKFIDALTNLGNEVRSNLTVDKKSSTTAGIIIVRLSTIQGVTAVGALVKETKQTIQNRGLVSAETASDSSVEGFQILNGLYGSMWCLLSRLEAVAQVVDRISKIHPYADLVWQTVQVLYTIALHQSKTNAKLIELIDAVNSAFDFAGSADKIMRKSELLAGSIKRLLQTTIECCHFIQGYAASNITKRILSVGSSQEIGEYKARFSELKAELDWAAGLQTVDGIEKIIPEQQRLKLRDRLKPVDLSERECRTCFEDTRAAVREEIIEHLSSDDEQNVIWLYGVAGSGKSTIATTVEDYFRKQGQLGAFLSFERGKSRPRSVIRTIAYKLAMFDRSIASRIVDVVDRDNDITEAIEETQFEKLLMGPLKADVLGVVGSIIIVLDGMDECGTSADRARLLYLFHRNLHLLPKRFRFLITSRRETDIAKALSCLPCLVPIELDYSSVESRTDVQRYIDFEMRRIFKSADLVIPSVWGWESKMTILGTSARGLFIWASTAIELVKGSKGDQFGVLEDLVSFCQQDNRCSRPEGFNLDGLYAAVLDRSEIAWKNSRLRARFSQVLSLILFSKIRLSISTIDGILGLPPTSSSRFIVERLQSVLAFSPNDPDAPVLMCHTSFSDYLLSPDRRKNNDPWFIDVSREKQMIACHCFNVMAKSLRFNICDIESSFVRNDEVVGLADRIKDKIKQHLEYACRFWAEHMCEAPASSSLPEVRNKLSYFAKHHLLYWFEVLSLTKHFRRQAGRTLLDAVMWTASYDAELSRFLWDAYRLASIYSTPISQSIPHIYLSVAPFAKGESVVADHYFKAHDAIQVQRRGTKPSASRMKTFKGHASKIWTVSVTPDGRRVVSRSKGKTVRIWDGESGEFVSGPFEGHTDGIRSVAISPDYKHVVSGSEDKTICIWDAESGELVLGPLVGHARGISSVAITSDGKRVVSGSWDETIRIWDAESGKLVSGPFEGHTGGISSVAITSDGRRVVSGSLDMTVRIWDAERGKLVSGLFEGHTGSISSVAITPDGRRVVSGSWDETVRIWDVESAKLVLGPLEGYIGGIVSVAISPNGKRVVSGSESGSICVWDAESGELVSNPFEGHTCGIMSVAFAPDSRRVVSGSWDKTICIWDADSSELLSGPFEGHTDGIWSVAVTCDGRRVVSGSEDKTIRTWDAESGELICGPFEGHTRVINSVDITPNGNRVVSGSADGSVHIWDAESGELSFGPFVEHTRGIVSVAIAPNGKRVVSGSWDGMICIWDGRELGLASSSSETDTMCDWVLSEDGWIIDEKTQLLLWTPPDIRPTLSRPSNTAVLSCRFSTRLEFTSSALGRGWRNSCTLHEHQN